MRSIIKIPATLTIVALGAFLALSGTVFAEEKAEYLGVDNCKTCHMPHYDSWHQTRMSKAFELLKPGERAEAKTKAGLDPARDYTKEPACLGCHTTGYGEPGGFVNFSTTPEMVGVQCEMCHGAGGRYYKMMYKKKGTYKREDFIKAGLTLPSEENGICIKKCHNPKSPFVKPGYKFDFQDRKAIGTHRHDLQYIYMDIDLY